jgi:hypothetical protein
MDEHEQCEKKVGFVPTRGHEFCERRSAIFIPLEDPIPLLRSIREAMIKTEIPPEVPEYFYPIIIKFPKPIVFYTNQDHFVRFMMVEEGETRISMIPGKELFSNLRSIKYGLAALARKMAAGYVSLHGFVDSEKTILAHFTTHCETGISLFELEWQDDDVVRLLGTQFSREVIRNYFHDRTLSVQFALEIREVRVEKAHEHYPRRAIVHPLLTHIRILDRDAIALKDPAFARSIKVPIDQLLNTSMSEES